MHISELKKRQTEWRHKQEGIDISSFAEIQTILLNCIYIICWYIICYIASHHANLGNLTQRILPNEIQIIFIPHLLCKNFSDYLINQNPVIFFSLSFLLFLIKDIPWPYICTVMFDIASYGITAFQLCSQGFRLEVVWWHRVDFLRRGGGNVLHTPKKKIQMHFTISMIFNVAADISTGFCQL